MSLKCTIKTYDIQPSGYTKVGPYICENGESRLAYILLMTCSYYKYHDYFPVPIYAGECVDGVVKSYTITKTGEIDKRYKPLVIQFEEFLTQYPEYLDVLECIGHDVDSGKLINDSYDLAYYFAYYVLHNPHEYKNTLIFELKCKLGLLSLDNSSEIMELDACEFIDWCKSRELMWKDRIKEMIQKYDIKDMKWFIENGKV